MRLILIARILGRQLCRIGLHRWRPVRNITSLQLRNVSPSGPAFTADFYFTDRCIRPGCRAERQP